MVGHWTLLLMTLAVHTCSFSTVPSPIDGEWSEWSEWEKASKCTVWCGGGEKETTRYRTCTHPPPSNGGDPCQGEDRQNQTVDCNTEECGDLCPPGEDTYIAADDSRYYYHCQQGLEGVVNTRAILLRCPEKLVWDQTVLTCVYRPDDSTPITTPTPVTSCAEGAKRADPDDCAFYFECVSGSELQRSCPPGTKFDNSGGYCNHASLVDC